MAVLTSNLTVDVFVIFVGLLVVVVAYFKWCFQYWSRRGVHCRTPVVPLGNADDIFRRRTTLGEQMMSIYSEFKAKGLRYGGYYLLSKAVLIVVDIDLVKNVFTKDFQHFTHRGIYVNEKNDPLTENLLRLKGLQWKNLRSKLTPAFTSGKMKMMFQTLLVCSEELLTVMNKCADEHQDVDIKDVAARYTTDVIGSCAFGIDCNSLRNPNAEFRQHGKKLFEVDGVQGLKAFLAIAYPRALDIFKVRLVRPDSGKFFMNAVAETVHNREANKVTRKDFMQLLIQLKNNVNICDGEDAVKTSKEPSDLGKGLTMSQVAAQAFVFFLAGFETSSTTLTFCLYELVTNTTIQEKLRKEINDVLEKHCGSFTYDALAEMAYMDKCVNETLRKYPPGATLSRECTKTYKIPDSDVVLEKGTCLFVPVLGIHRDPEFYPDPEKFDPERFSPENMAKRNAYTWLPFGGGPRICIGLRFGIMLVKVALVILLKNYRFGLSPKTKTPLVMNPDLILLGVKGKVWLTTQKIAEK